MTSSIEGDDEEKSSDHSKVPNTPLSGAQKILPEFEEVQAKRSHSIRLNSKGHSQRSSQKNQSKHTERDDPKNPDTLLTGVTVNIVSAGGKKTSAQHTSKHPSSNGSKHDLNNKSKTLKTQ